MNELISYSQSVKKLKEKREYNLKLQKELFDYLTNMSTFSNNTELSTDEYEHLISLTFNKYITQKMGKIISDLDIEKTIWKVLGSPREVKRD
jgi:hypothetical protein